MVHLQAVWNLRKIYFQEEKIVTIGRIFFQILGVMFLFLPPQLASTKNKFLSVKLEIIHQRQYSNQDI